MRVSKNARKRARRKSFLQAQIKTANAVADALCPSPKEPTILWEDNTQTITVTGLNSGTVTVTQDTHGAAQQYTIFK